MSNWKIGTRITAGFAIVICITVVLGLFSASRVRSIGLDSNDLAVNRLPSSVALFQVQANLYHTASVLAREAKSTDPEQIRALDAEVRAVQQSSELALKTYQSLPMGDQEANVWRSLEEFHQRYLSTYAEALRMSESPIPADSEKAVKYFDERLIPLSNQYAAVLQTLLDINRQRTSAHATAIVASVGNTSRAVWVGILASVMGAVPIALFIVRGITRPLRQAVAVLGCVAEGDLTQTLDVDSKDEVGIMAVSLNAALSQVRNTLRQVAESAAEARGSSRELAAAAESIASGAQQQAASLEETSASIEQITATVRQSAENAREANDLAVTSRESAERGQGVVSGAVTAMSEIDGSSAKIAEIISTIDEIAFQTNLLAVNAAVEAARAGEEGRGFAVVATEVRSLAQRSAGAAKEIKALIQDSLRKVEKGTEFVNRSGETLGGIVGSIRHVSSIVAEMALAVKEQSSGLEQVNTAMTQMDQVTQANSAHTEELSATAKALSEQADRLMSLVATFKLEKNQEVADHRHTQRQNLDASLVSTFA